jgi:hypothetical protein
MRLVVRLLLWITGQGAHLRDVKTKIERDRETREMVEVALRRSRGEVKLLKYFEQWRPPV